jgi:hypothetical protein
MHFDRELDVKGLNCPLPILRTKKALSEMSTGEVLHVLATDPGSVKDFRLSPGRPAMSCCRASRRTGLSSITSSANRVNSATRQVRRRAARLHSLSER